jgi:photosystem II stability/assembly factor-like uncharacterized protein
MKYLIFIYSFILVSVTVNAQSKWRVHNMNNNATEDYNDVYFLDEDNGFIVGDSGLFLETFNGGLTWSRRDSFTKRFGDIRSIYFENDSVGYLSTGFALRKTEDRGRTWKKYGPWVYKNHMGSRDEGVYFYGDAGFGSFTISIHSKDQDTLAHHQGFFPMYSLERAKLITDSTLIIVQDTGRVYISTDLGTTISRVFSPQDHGFENHFSKSIEFINKDTGFITYDGSLFLSTKDGGLSWSIDTSLDVTNFIEPTTGTLSLVGEQLYRSNLRVSWFYREYTVENFIPSTMSWELLHKNMDWRGFESYQGNGHLHGSGNNLYLPLDERLLYFGPDSLTSTIEIVKEDFVGIYPNPSRGDVTINLKEKHELKTIWVYGTNGNEVYSKEYSPGIFQTKLELEIEGVFTIIIEDSQGNTHSKRIIIER